MSEDLRLHLARGQSFVAIRVTFVADPIVGRRDAGQSGKTAEVKSTDSVGRPDGVSGLVEMLVSFFALLVAPLHRQIRQPDLLEPTRPLRKRMLLPSGKLNA